MVRVGNRGEERGMRGTRSASRSGRERSIVKKGSSRTEKKRRAGFPHYHFKKAPLETQGGRGRRSPKGN